MTTAEQAQRRRVFYDALNSGKFKQLRGEMRFISGDRQEHCCLAVAQELYEADQGDAADTESGYSGGFFYRTSIEEPAVCRGEEITILSLGASQYYGFPGTNPHLRHVDGRAVHSAAYWNDEIPDTDFPAIAKMFEETFPTVADEE